MRQVRVRHVLAAALLVVGAACGSSLPGGDLDPDAAGPPVPDAAAPPPDAAAPPESDAAPSLACGPGPSGPGGELDTSYPGVLNTGTRRSWIERILPLGDGGVLFAGNANDGFQLLFGRLAADGLPDASFGDNGLIYADARAGLSGSSMWDADLASDGHFYVIAYGSDATTSISERGVARFDAAGQPDVTFGGDGWVELWLSHGLYVLNVQAHGDGALVSGTTEDQFQRVHAIARLLADGSLDPAFGVGGILVDSFPDWENQGSHELIVDDAGRIWTFTGVGRPEPPAEGLAAARYLATGERDDTYGLDGMTSVIIPSGRPVMRTATVDCWGQVIFGTIFYDYSTLLNRTAAIRLTPDGALDPSFGVGGVTEGGGSTPWTGLAALAPDGSIVTAGWDTNYPDGHVVTMRFLPNGALDVGYGAGGTLAGDIGDAETLVVDTDGTILVGGGTWPSLTRVYPRVQRFIP